MDDAIPSDETVPELPELYDEEMDTQPSMSDQNDNDIEHEELKGIRGERSRPDDIDNYVLKNGLWYKKSLKCRYCHYKAAWPSEIKRHEQFHLANENNAGGKANSEPKSFTCCLCNTPFDSQGNLSKHMNLVHRAAAKSKNLLSVLQKIKKSPQDGESESNAEEDGSPEKSAKLQDDPSNMIGGTAKEPFCKVCGYKAKWVSELEKHIRVHTQEKPYPCPYCKHSARWKGDLTRHIQKIHPAKLDEFYEMTGHKRKMRQPKPHPVQYNEGNNKMVFPGMEQPPEQSDPESDISSDSGDEPMELQEDAVTDVPPPNAEEPRVASPNVSEHSMSITNVSAPPQPAPANSSQSNQPALTGSGMTVLKKVKRCMYKCLDCEFTSRTASRFHVHIVQHLNKRPYMCSECGYRSNWEWDITKHIKIKIQRKEGHDSAKVLLIDEAGRKNYEKYEKFKIEVEEEVTVDQLPALEINQARKPNTIPAVSSKENQSLSKGPLKVTYKCRTCDFRDPSKRAVITHIISHLGRYIIPGCGITDSKLLEGVITNDPFVVKSDQGEELYVCKICPYKSRRNFYIKFHVKQHQQRPGANYKCHFCPYWVNFRKTLLKHLKLHVNEPHTYLREVESLLVIETPIAQVKSEAILTPKKSVIPSSLSRPVSTAPKIAPKEPLVAPNANCSPAPSSNELSKRGPEQKKKFFCEHCPYESDNRTQYLYHKQFHRPNRPAAHKCRFCSYSVSHLHLLRQHMKVHLTSNGSDVSSESDGWGRKSPTINASNFPMLGGRSLDLEGKEDAGDSSIPYVLIRQGDEMVKMFKCRYCPLVNRRRANVRVHEQMHTKGTHAKFICPLCNYQCNNQGVLTAHIKIHQSTEIDSHVRAATSNKSIDQRLTIPEPIPMVTPMKQPSNVPPHLLVSMPVPRPKYRAQNYRCKKCPGIFKTQNDLDNHLKFHGINLPFRCHVCDYAARCKPHLHNHVKVHGEQTTSFVENELDVEVKTSDTNALQFLPQSTSTPSVTITPMPSKQQRLSNPNPEQNALLVEEANACVAQLEGLDGSIACSLCPATFKVMYLMQFHKALHGSGGQYRCTRCSYAVASPKNMAAHGRLHAGSTSAPSTTIHLQQMKPYRCPKCPAMFNKVARFQRHVSLHGVKNRYRCDQCDYAVRYAANLIKHKQVHHQNVTPSHRFDENDQLSIRPVNMKSKDTPTLQAVFPLRFVSGKTAQKSATTPLQQHQQNKEWLHESVNHVIAEDIDPKTRVFRCNRCPYIHGRKDAVQNHLRRHVAYQGLCCPHCDYYTMHMCFLRDHMKLHFKQGMWMKQHNFAFLNGAEITATTIGTGEKEVIFKDKGKDLSNDRFEPEPVEEPNAPIETNSPLEKVQVKQEPMDVSDFYIPESVSQIDSYSESSFDRYDGLSMVPSMEHFPKGISHNYKKQIQDMYEDDDSRRQVEEEPNESDDGPMPARDYVQAMQNVENLGYEDVLHAIDKFMKDDYVPVKDASDENEFAAADMEIDQST